MITRYPPKTDPAAGKQPDAAAEQHGGSGHDEDCRCKETARMSPQELLRRMMSDLAFWKRPKK